MGAREQLGHPGVDRILREQGVRKVQQQELPLRGWGRAGESLRPPHRRLLLRRCQGHRLERIALEWQADDRLVSRGSRQGVQSRGRLRQPFGQAVAGQRHHDGAEVGGGRGRKDGRALHQRHEPRLPHGHHGLRHLLLPALPRPLRRALGLRPLRLPSMAAALAGALARAPQERGLAHRIVTTTIATCRIRVTTVMRPSR
mmetsp:Transcript_19194/g.50699  ORF Transcript_19194/g.50699 Transcript_19194/m.50699 type:complete len:200 (-) Transcript_19194:78-677(-)